jgi:glutamyl-tRNA synthetase
MSVVRVRFAPSPTGYLHIGNLRQGLFDYFIAKHYEGQLILRLEDTDRNRLVEGADEKLLKVFRDLDLEFDEGPKIGGPYAPYIQSERTSIYNDHLAQLLNSKQIYHCFCSAERLTAMRDEQSKNKLPPRYDRLCRNLSKVEVDRRLAEGAPYVIRQAMPLEGEITLKDEIHEPITFRMENLEDHVLIKTDGMPTYQFASVVDDHMMKITHVVRGDEWISSYPKNILLYRAFGWTPPKFIHAPLILNKEGGKLSKRQGDVAVEDFLKKGYLPEALINFCALLGWHPKGENEILSLSDIIREFKIEDIGTSPAIFDLEKLDYLNGYYIRKKTTEELTGLVIPYLVEAKLIDLQGQKFLNNQSGEEVIYPQLLSIVRLAHDRLRKFSEIGELVDFMFIKPRYEVDLLKWKQFTNAEIQANLKELVEAMTHIPSEDWTKQSLEDALMSHIQAKGKTNGEYLWPMRVALSGRKASPGPFEIAEALGLAKTVERIKTAIEKLS